MFWILFLIFSSLSGEGFPSAMAHFESGLPCIAGGYVNVVTGAPLLQCDDLVIPGIEPLTISRSFRYDPNWGKEGKSGYSSGWDPHLSEELKRKVDEDGGVHFFHTIDSQPMFYFKNPRDHPYDINNHGCRNALDKDFFFGPRFCEHQSGATNIGHGYPSGRYALKNTHLKRNGKVASGRQFNALMASGNGEKKIFTEEEVPNVDIKGFRAVLKELHAPNGFKHIYRRENNLTTGIEVQSPSGKKVADVRVDYIKDPEHPKIGIWGPDGRHTALTYRQKGALLFSDLKLLVVNTSDHPEIRYNYDGNQLDSITLPDERGVKFTYWKDKDYIFDRKGRQEKLTEISDTFQKIKTIEQPVRANSNKITTHLFHFFPRRSHASHPDKDEDAMTRVVICEGHIDDYRFDDSFYLQEISHYTNPEKTSWVTFPTYPLKHTCDFREQFKWSNKGEILEKRHCDGDGNKLRSVSYAYDERGNVLEETFIGNITGGGNKERYAKKSTYSNDGFNLLLSERLPSGLEIHYEYLHGTNLLTKRTMLSGEEIYREESFEYDEDHCLIRSDEITALTHRVEKITPSKEIPFGYPIEKKIFAVGPDGEELQETYLYRYNARGDIVFEEKRDRKGQLIFSVEKTFDGHGNCTQELDSLKRCVTRKFDKNDNCIEEVGPRPGFVKRFCYDFMNRRTQEAISYEGETWVTDHVYNELNQRTKTTNYLGNATETEYDRYGRPIKISLPKILVEDDWKTPVFQKKYDPFGNEVESTDSLNQTTVSKFTARDKLYEVTHSDLSKQTIVYSLESLPVQITDEDGVVTTFTYDPLGRPLSKQTPHGEELYRYVGLHLVEKVDREGVSTHYRYDALGRIVETKTEHRRETVTYDDMGHPYRKAHYGGDKLLSTEVSHVDALGRIIETYLEDPSGAIFNQKCFVYDVVGNCIEERNGRSTTKRTFDWLNRVVQAVDEQGNTHRVFYRRVEHEGQSVEEKTVVDPNGQQVITLYDALGKESMIRHLNPAGIELYRKEIGYDLAGHVIKEAVFTETDQRILLKAYDTRGRVITLTEPLKKVTHMSYTPGGKLKVLSKPDGVKLTHEYVEGRLDTLKSSDHQLYYVYHYNKRGELIEVVDQLTGLKSLQSFSSIGELVQETLPTGETITYTYDGLGRMTSYSLPDGGQALLTYNARAATSVARLDAHHHELYRHAYTQFDDLGNVIEEMLIGKGGKLTTTFDSLYQLSSIAHPHLTQKNLLYDPAGNLLSYEKNGESFPFHYDDLYQLTKEKEHSYTYDPFYNRTSKDNDSYQVNELNQLLSDRDTTYTYDLNGNLLQLEDSHRKLVFSYDPLNRLISIDNGQEQVTFTYDAFHRRLTRNGVSFHFCREQEIGFENSLRLLGPGLGADIGAAIAIELDGTPFAPLHNHQGSIIGLVDLKGNLQASWDYTAYGELIGICASPWGFASKRQEPLTGWISFGRRDYDPTTGRWTTPDPLGFDAGPNLYTYVSNRPLTHRDPLGLIEAPIRALQERQSRMDGGAYCHADSSWEQVKDYAVGALMDGIDFAYKLSNLISYIGDDGVYSERHAWDPHYLCEMEIIDCCDYKNLPENSLIDVPVNGVGTSRERFIEICHSYAKLGLNVRGIYNPSHGGDIMGFYNDLSRARSGIRDGISSKRMGAFLSKMNEILTEGPKGARIFMFPHSEGNVLAGRALEHAGRNDRVGYFGMDPAYFINSKAVASCAFLVSPEDFVQCVGQESKRRVNPNNITIVSSYERHLFYHAIDKPEFVPYLLRARESFAKTNQIQVR